LPIHCVVVIIKKKRSESGFCNLFQGSSEYLYKAGSSIRKRKESVMKKRRRLLLITCVIIGFTMLTLTPASAFGGHRHYYGPHAYWGGALFGLGILTAALVTNSLLDHPEPVTVYRPAPVVALPPGTVVEQRVLPPVVRLPSPATGKATVTAVLLNVRSGPGKDFRVLCQVPQGTVLEIRGNAPGWYYVRLSDGHYGWVMTEFAARASVPADG
jgi:uncharacterized protein YgiM (DUF1202 family)